MKLILPTGPCVEFSLAEACQQLRARLDDSGAKHLRPLTTAERDLLAVAFSYYEFCDEINRTLPDKELQEIMKTILSLIYRLGGRVEGNL